MLMNFRDFRNGNFMLFFRTKFLRKFSNIFPVPKKRYYLLGCWYPIIPYGCTGSTFPVPFNKCDGNKNIPVALIWSADILSYPFGRWSQKLSFLGLKCNGTICSSSLFLFKSSFGSSIPRDERKSLACDIFRKSFWEKRKFAKRKSFGRSNATETSFITASKSCICRSYSKDGWSRI